MSETLPAVTVDRASKYYGRVLAVDDVSLEVEEGEFVTLLGPSGCGKTTLLRMISGFLEPTSGDIRLHGESVVGVPPYRRNTSMVFQDYALFPHRTVAQNLGFGLRMRKTPKEEIAKRVEEMLALLDLEGMGVRRISETSGGQQQRVALGRALIVEPAVLLLDEPLGALDFKLRKQMQTELKRIQRRVGITFIYVTHDQEEALTMSDRVAVMNVGRIEQCDTPEEIYKRPTSAFVADFVGETNFMTVRVTAIQGGEIRVRTAAGEAFPARLFGDRRLAEGDEVKLVVRPENITIVADPGADFVGVLGTVEDVVFSGATAKVTALIGAGTQLQVNVNPDSSLPESGTKAGFSWAPDSAVIVA
jgi:spermidine/putrescine ABC transporter ATP-binding subunit